MASAEFTSLESTQAVPTVETPTYEEQVNVDTSTSTEIESTTAIFQAVGVITGSVNFSSDGQGVQPGYLQFGTLCKQMLQKPILRFTNLPKNGIETFKFLHTKINSSRDSVS